MCTFLWSSLFLCSALLLVMYHCLFFLLCFFLYFSCDSRSPFFHMYFFACWVNIPCLYLKKSNMYPSYTYLPKKNMISLYSTSLLASGATRRRKKTYASERVSEQREKVIFSLFFAFFLFYFLLFCVFLFLNYYSHCWCCSRRLLPLQLLQPT